MRASQIKYSLIYGDVYGAVVRWCMCTRTELSTASMYSCTWGTPGRTVLVGRSVLRHSHYSLSKNSLYTTKVERVYVYTCTTICASSRALNAACASASYRRLVWRCVRFARTESCARTQPQNVQVFYVRAHARVLYYVVQSERASRTDRRNNIVCFRNLSCRGCPPRLCKEHYVLYSICDMSK